MYIYYSEHQQRYESQLEHWESERNAWRELIEKKQMDPDPYYHNLNLERELQDLQNPLRQQLTPDHDTYYKLAPKNSYDNQAFEFDLTESSRATRVYHPYASLDPYHGMKSADDILNSPSPSMTTHMQTYLTDGLPSLPRKTYLMDDPIEQTTISNVHTKLPHRSPVQQNTWQQGAISFNSIGQKGHPGHIEQPLDTSYTKCNGKEGTLSPFQQQLNAILQIDDDGSHSQPTSTIRATRTTKQQLGKTQPTTNLNLFRPIPNSNQNDSVNKLPSVVTRRATISKEIQKKRKSNIQDELTELEQHFEALGLDSEDHVSTSKHLEHGKPCNYHLQRTMLHDQHEPSPESLEVAKFNGKDRIQQSLAKDSQQNMITQYTILDQTYILPQAISTSSPRELTMGRVTSRIEPTKQHLSYRYDQHTKPGSIQPVCQHPTDLQYLGQQGRQYSTPTKPLVLIRPRSTSLERPHNDGTTQSEPTSPLKQRRPSLPDRKTYAQGVTQMVNIFNNKTLRPSNSAPNLTDSSAFSRSYDVQGEPLAPYACAGKENKNIIINRKQQTPRIVKHRSEQKNKVKTLNSHSGSESEGYSSSGLDSSNACEKHALKSHDLSSGSSGMESQSSGECLSMLQKNQYRESMAQLTLLPERESNTTRSAPNLCEQTGKQISRVQRQLPDKRNLQYQQHHSYCPGHSIQVTPSPPPPSSSDRPIPNVTVKVQTRQSPLRSTQPPAVNNLNKTQLANSRTLELVDQPSIKQPSFSPAQSNSLYAPLRAPSVSPRYSYNSDTSHWNSTDQLYPAMLSPDQYSSPHDIHRQHPFSNNRRGPHLLTDISDLPHMENQITEVTKAVAKVEPTLAEARPLMKNTSLR